MRIVFPDTPYRLQMGSRTALSKWLYPPNKKDLYRYRRSEVPAPFNKAGSADSLSFSSLSVMDYFVDWYPSTLTVLSNYSLLFLPDSYTSADEHSDNDADGVGNFTVYQPTKVVWQKLKMPVCIRAAAEARNNNPLLSW